MSIFTDYVSLRFYLLQIISLLNQYERVEHMHIRDLCQKNTNWCENTANMEFQVWITYLCSWPKSSKINAFIQNFLKAPKTDFFFL